MEELAQSTTDKSDQAAVDAFAEHLIRTWHVLNKLAKEKKEEEALENFNSLSQVTQDIAVSLPYVSMSYR